MQTCWYSFSLSLCCNEMMFNFKQPCLDTANTKKLQLTPKKFKFYRCFSKKHNSCILYSQAEQLGWGRRAAVHPDGDGSGAAAHPVCGPSPQRQGLVWGMREGDCQMKCQHFVRISTPAQSLTANVLFNFQVDQDVLITNSYETAMRTAQNFLSVFLKK